MKLDFKSVCLLYYLHAVNETSAAFHVAVITGPTLFEPSVCWHCQQDKVPGRLQEEARSWQGEGSLCSTEAMGDVPCYFGPLSARRASQRDTETAGAQEV